MVNPWIFVVVILSFAVTFFSTKFWITRAKKAGLVGYDVHKKNKPTVAEMGGIPVLLGFLIGLLGYVAIRTFSFREPEVNLQLMAALATVLLAGLLGLVDDILGWKIGLKQWQKPLLMIIATLPIIVVNAGVHALAIPLIGTVDFGLLYPLLIVPIIIVVTANGFNMLAGYNGLEAGQGIILLTTLGLLAFTQVPWVTVLAGIMVASLLAFLWYNKFPAKIFPGNGFTHAVGALIGVVAILGNNEKALVILFIPYALEFFLKLRGKFQKESFAKVLPDGTLTNRYKKWYGLEHSVIASTRALGIAREQFVVLVLWLVQIIFATIAILL